MKYKFVAKVLFLVILSSALTSCSFLNSSNPPSNVQADVEATLNAIKTESFATVAAQFTQTAAAIPTDTPYPTPAPITATPLPPTATAIPTSTPFPTFVLPTLPLPIIVVSPTSTITLTPTSAAYGCKIVSQSPSLGQQVAPGYDFDMHWVVKNTGTKDWDQGDVDYKYVSGEELHKYASGVDFPKTVKSGEEVDLAVDMAAPSNPGTYSAQWAIVRSDNVICTLSVKIVVK